MRYLLFFTCMLFISCGNDTKNAESANISEEGISSTYYLIRHAEKDRTVVDDPGLLPIGLERANHWANYFEDIPLDQVYSTNYNRTKETAAPTASKKGLTVAFYDPANLFDEAFQEATRGKQVLVVGHSNTTPAFVNTIIGEKKYRQISDTENGMLYTVILKENGESEVKVDTIPFN